MRNDLYFNVIQLKKRKQFTRSFDFCFLNSQQCTRTRWTNRIQHLPFFPQIAYEKFMAENKRLNMKTQIMVAIQVFIAFELLREFLFSLPVNSICAFKIGVPVKLFYILIFFFAIAAPPLFSLYNMYSFCRRGCLFPDYIWLIFSSSSDFIAIPCWTITMSVCDVLQFADMHSRPTAANVYECRCGRLVVVQLCTPYRLDSYPECYVKSNRSALSEYFNFEVRKDSMPGFKVSSVPFNTYVSEKWLFVACQSRMSELVVKNKQFPIRADINLMKQQKYLHFCHINISVYVSFHAMSVCEMECSVGAWVTIVMAEEEHRQGITEITNYNCVSTLKRKPSVCVGFCCRWLVVCRMELCDGR